MTKEIVLLDLFSGMGGFAKGLEDAGFIIKKHYFSENNKHAIANYQYNFKNSIYVGAIQSIDRAALGKVDIITFGSPCQDFSVAGACKGLDGERSSLILEAIKIIIEKKPSFFIWENVKGAFSSNDGADFWAILQAFANIGAYNIEWQLLNTLWILPQNRERIYLAGHLTTSERDFKPVFPFTKNDRLFNNQEIAKKRQSQAEHSGTISGECYRADNTIIKVAATLTGGGHSGGLHSDMTIIKAINTQPRNGNPKKGGTGIIEKQDSTYCIDTKKGQAIQINSDQYRRLTEIECERLQGFPDDWTKFGIYNNKIKVIKQTNRYKMIGNAVTKNFPEMIGKKLIENYNL